MAKIAFSITTLTVVSFLTISPFPDTLKIGLFSDMPFSVHIREEQGFTVFQLSEDSGISAEILSLGGILNRYMIPVKGKSVNLVNGLEDLSAAREKIADAFQGARLSPFVCRMRKGEYSWLGTTYRIQKKYLGAHAIHGLMYDSLFQLVETRADEKGAVVVLESEYDGWDPGYPFPYRVRLEWILGKEAMLSVTSMVWHENEFEIPLAEGWHPYFTLGGKVDEWELEFNTHRKMEYDAELLPTGQLIPDERFLKGCSLAGIHLDNGFVWMEEEGEEQRCILRNKDIQLTLLPDRSFPVLQVFTPDDRNSIALENLSGAPDNFNNRLLLISLPPGVQQIFKTRYQAVAQS